MPSREDAISPRFRRLVLPPTFMAPVLGGAILYYLLKSERPALANYANKMSWVAFVLWFVLGIVLMALPREPTMAIRDWVGAITFTAGVVLALRSVWIILRSDPTE